MEQSPCWLNAKMRVVAKPIELLESFVVQVILSSSLHVYQISLLFNTCLTSGFECNDSDIRLVNGSSMREGVVEICFDGVWGTVCASGVDNVVASVICRRLGFSDAGTYILVVPG